jgi:transposase
MSGEKRDRRRRYTAEDREKAVRLVRLRRAETGEKHGSVTAVAEQLDFGAESVRSWVNQADIDDGVLAGTTSEDAARIKKLEQEVKDLRRANGILKTASAFFAAELDRPQK